MSGKTIDSEFYPSEDIPFYLDTVNPLWSKEMMLGFYDYYNEDTIKAYQIIPKERTLDIPFMESKFNLNLQRSAIQKEVRIESLIGDIGLLSNEFKNDIAFWNIECEFSFSSNKNIFKEEFEISASRIKKLTLFGDHFFFFFKGELENRDLTGNILEAYIKEIYISETNFTQGFDFNGLGKKLDRFEIKSNPELKGVLKFVGWIVDTTLVTGVNQNLKLLFKRISFRWFVINDFTNYGDVSFDKCNEYEGSTLNLSDRDLVSTKFNEFDFNSFTALKFDNVTLDKIRPTNNKWFSDKLIIEVAEQSEEDRFKRKQEKYRIRILSAIKKYYDYLVMYGYRNDHPCRKLNVKIKGNQTIQVQDLFNSTELQLLMERESRYKHLDVRNNVLILFLMAQFTLKVLPIKNAGTCAKTDDNETRPALLRGSSDKFILTKLGQPIVVNSIHAMIEPLRALFPDRKLNPQTIRMSVICNWLNEKNIPLEKVQELAGHKWPGTTEKYIKVNSTHQREMINRYFPNI